MRLRTCASAGVLLGLALACRPEPPAFPGAEGHGAASLGGRRGAVLFVESLADSGPGTLRAALEAEGARTVIFRVGGTITLQSPLVIRNPFVTVAGQTAPGDGIQLRNDPVAPYGLAADSFTSLVIDTHDVVIRYLRIRPGPLWPNPDCTGPNALAHPDGLETCVDAGDIQALELGPGAQRVMLDHLSLAWASDEIVDINAARDVSLQWSILSEGMDWVLYEGFSGPVTTSHGHGVIIGDRGGAAAGEQNGRLTFHHNLFALLPDRAPQITVNCSSAADPAACVTDVVNNYVYGWRSYGLSVENLLGHTYANVVGNYFRSGPDTLLASRAINLKDWAGSAWAIAAPAALGVHRSGNREWLSSSSQEVDPTCSRWNQTLARWDRCEPDTYDTAPYPTPAVTTAAARTAREEVLGDAGASRRLDATGAWMPTRDAADIRVIDDASHGTGRILGDLESFPGWPMLSGGRVVRDADRDGMPEAFEDRYGLDATRPDGTLDPDGDGYGNLEEYLNGTSPREP